MKTRTIIQTITIRASPHEIYEMWMDAEKHARFTGGAAEISREIGGVFSTNDRYSIGITTELVPDKRIVQTWRANDWPAGHYSTLIIELTPVDGKTRLRFTQEGVPDDQYEEIKEGWHTYYWNPLREALEKK
ncbi:MAG: SRPBCC domain-containing protein [Methanomicrobiales archaeon]|nr:SRPBCC domain-containing protein [Methanomicrobiales archaeon]